MPINKTESWDEMLKNNRITVCLLCLLLVLSTFTSCGGKADGTSDSELSLDTVPTGDDTDSDNDNGDDKYINVDFSLKGGMYDSEQKLVLSLPENAPNGSYITYTLNGDEPDANTQKYSKEITVCTAGSAACVRAACFSEKGEQLGRIKTNTYIRADKNRFSTVVVSLVTDEKNLYGTDGIMSNPLCSGKAWERPCHVEMFTSSGEEMISQDAGIRLFGGSSRTLAQKSFKLVARRDGYYDELKYNGNGSFDYPLFENRYVMAGENKGKLLERYDRLILRNGGNDSMQHRSEDGTSMTLLRDGVANNYALKYAEAVPAQASRFVTVYLNGEYYGILDMKEDINDDYFSNVYGIENKDNVAVIKSELDTSRKCIRHSNSSSCRYCGVWFYYELDCGGETELDEFEAFCKKILAANDENYNELYRELTQKFDIDNLIQYTALNLYICNTDWAHNNLRIWRYTGQTDGSNPYKDGRWRFTTRDMDFSFGRYESRALPELYTQADTDTFAFVLGEYNGDYGYDGAYGDPLYLKGILNFCLKNSDFKSKFEAYAKTLVSSQNVNDLTEMTKTARNGISSEIPYHITRWADTVSWNMSKRTWESSCRNQLDWINERSEKFSAYLEKCMKKY